MYQEYIVNYIMLKVKNINKIGLSLPKKLKHEKETNEKTVKNLKNRKILKK